MDILNKNVIYNGWSTLTRYGIPFIRPDGEEIIVYREVFNSGDGVAALLYDTSRKIVILTRQFRIAAFINGHSDGKLLEACAGMVEGMDAIEAIKKEILEETGYQIKNVERVTTVFATPGAHTEKVTLFLAACNVSQKVESGGGLTEEHEDIEIVEFSFREIIQMVKRGKIDDAKTLILIQHAMLKGIIQEEK